MEGGGGGDEGKPSKHVTHLNDRLERKESVDR